jgi:tripartite-type tricarboxylate transporter receptor subunit TctC
MFTLALSSLLLAGTLAHAADNDFTRPIRFISAMAPGGSGDLNARRLADALRQRIGNSVVVENRAGGGGNIAAVAAASATPDGNTLFFASEQIFTVNPHITDKLPFRLEDFQPLSLISKTPHILLVSSSLPPNTLAELISYAKSRPAPLNFGSGGVGTSPHLAGELFKGLAGINLSHVPYRGASLSLTALMSTEIQLLFDSTLTALGHIRGGRARGLAIANLTRLPLIAELPTFAESGFPGFEAGVTHGLLLPAATPALRVAALSRAINDVLNDAAYRKQMADVGAQVVGGTPESFRVYLIAERKKWAEVIKRQKIAF